MGATRERRVYLEEVERIEEEMAHIVGLIDATKQFQELLRILDKRGLIEQDYLHHLKSQVYGVRAYFEAERLAIRERRNGVVEG
jgi:hypothetical protein